MLAAEDAAYYFDAVVFAQGKGTGVGYLVVGGEAGDGLLEALELGTGDAGVGGAGTAGGGVAPGEVADAAEDAHDVSGARAEEDYGGYEGAAAEHHLFLYYLGDFLAGVEEGDGGQGRLLRLDTAVESAVSDSGTHAHGVPSEGVDEEYGRHLRVYSGAAGGRDVAGLGEREHGDAGGDMSADGDDFGCGGSATEGGVCPEAFDGIGDVVGDGESAAAEEVGEETLDGERYLPARFFRLLKGEDVLAAGSVQATRGDCLRLGVGGDTASREHGDLHDGGASGDEGVEEEVGSHGCGALKAGCAFGEEECAGEDLVVDALAPEGFA